MSRVEADQAAQAFYASMESPTFIFANWLQQFQFGTGESQITSDETRTYPVPDDMASGIARAVFELDRPDFTQTSADRAVTALLLNMPVRVTFVREHEGVLRHTVGNRPKELRPYRAGDVIDDLKFVGVATTSGQNSQPLVVVSETGRSAALLHIPDVVDTVGPRRGSTLVSLRFSDAGEMS